MSFVSQFTARDIKDSYQEKGFRLIYVSKEWREVDKLTEWNDDGDMLYA